MINMFNRILNYVQRKILTLLLLGRVSSDTYFKYVYKFNYWEDSDSRSGPGSNMHYTEKIRNSLPIIFENFCIRTVFDTPCGDFHWMSSVMANSNVNYIGGDLVKELIQQNATRYANLKNVKFTTFDITRDKFPLADLWICRDVHFHLSFADIVKSLEEFSRSSVQYVLLTSHIQTTSAPFKNEDIISGGFRLLDMTKYPFNLAVTPHYRFDDYIEPHPAREMLLYDRTQIASALPMIKSNINLSR